MCGIAGIVNLNNNSANPAIVQDMMNIMKHRGPDDEGIFTKDNICLGHVRLSIIDLSAAGHQPMFSADQRYCIVFNGEIYNYVELKKELEGKYIFKTRTDTEVLLASYLVWGEDCLNKFNGDFAFVIYDQQNNEIFGARDRFGIKPFYFYNDDKTFMFASEIKAIIPHIQAPKPNNKLIFEYLIYNRTDQSDETFFENIVKLKHGHCFTVKNNKLSIRRWYNLAEKINHPTPMTPEQYREELKSSINLRLRSDVPLGVSLSGGIDSSAVTSIVFHDFGVKDLKTFSAVYEKGNWADESVFIDTYKDTLSHMYYTQPTADVFYNDFKNFIRAQGEPVAAIGPYAQYKVMELAHGNVVVTLDGQGSDEMLGGYHYFFGGYFKELLKQLNILTLTRESMAYLLKHHSFYAFKYMAYYMLPVSQKKNVGSKLFGSVNKDFFNSHNTASTIDADLYNPSTLNESFLQHFEHKLEHLLKWDDLNSLSFSIESRVPFLDHNLVEKTLSLPSNQVIHNAVTKHILRESVKDVLPPSIYNRKDKKGFTTPSDSWFRSQIFQKFITNMLNSQSFKERGYFDVDDCKRKYQLHLEGKADLSKDIWKWINLEVWFQEFIDKK
jgi:asparagine synthase (glutamine-hydrolysing)